MSFQLLKWDMIPTRWPTLLANVGINYGRHELADVVQRERAHLGERADAVVGVHAPGEDSGNGGHVSEGGIELSSRLIARFALEVEPAVTCGHARARRQQRLVHRAEMHTLAATHERRMTPCSNPGTGSRKFKKV